MKTEKELKDLFDKSTKKTCISPCMYREQFVRVATDLLAEQEKELREELITYTQWLSMNTEAPIILVDEYLKEREK
jgi:hypothetical protein